MSKHPQMNFDSLRPAGSAAEGRSEPSFEPRDAALDLHALAVLHLWKAAVHLTPVLGLGPPASAPLVQVDHRAADAKLVSGVRVVVLGVVAGVGEQAVNADAFARAAQHRRQQRRVLAGPVAHQRVDQQVRGVVAGQRQLGPATQAVAFLPGPVGVMGRSVARLQAGRIDADFFLGPDQPLPARVIKDAVEQGVEHTFLSRRCCAL